MNKFNNSKIDDDIHLKNLLGNKYETGDINNDKNDISTSIYSNSNSNKKSIVCSTSKNSINGLKFTDISKSIQTPDKNNKKLCLTPQDDSKRNKSFSDFLKKTKTTYFNHLYFQLI